MSIQLIDRFNLDTLDWPDTVDGDYARRYLVPFIEQPPHTFISNVETDVMLVRVGNTILPITKSIWNPNNSYVCSPYTHYITYGQEEFRELKNPPVESFLKLLFHPIAAYFRQTNFDQTILVNNWLLSTNLYPPISGSQIAEALTFLKHRFPDHALVFRSLDTRSHPQLLSTLKEQGANLIFSRSVYYQDVQSDYVQRKQQFRFDFKHFQRTPYKILAADQLADSDLPRLVGLYDDLYLRKYSYYNPQFTEAFLRLALAHNLLTIKAFSLDGRIDAVMGYFARNGIATPPLFGYDTSLPKQLGLYRLLSTFMSLEAQQHNLLVHFSAGVGRFKRLRGGLNAIEYNAVYTDHLPPHRRRPWVLLHFLMARVAVPIITRYGF